MIKIFKCEKCGMAFNSEEDCLEHEQNCNKELEEKIINKLARYGITTQHVAISLQLDGTYQGLIKATVPSGYIFDIEFGFEDETKITTEFMNDILSSYMRTAFEGKISNEEERYDGYTTFCINNNDDIIDLSLIAQVYEGHNIKVEILD